MNNRKGRDEQWDEHENKDERGKFHSKDNNGQNGQCPVEERIDS